MHLLLWQSTYFTLTFLMTDVLIYKNGSHCFSPFISLDGFSFDITFHKGKDFIRHKAQYAQQILSLILMNIYTSHSSNTKQVMLQWREDDDSGEPIVAEIVPCPTSVFVFFLTMPACTVYCLFSHSFWGVALH